MLPSLAALNFPSPGFKSFKGSAHLSLPSNFQNWQMPLGKKHSPMFAFSSLREAYLSEFPELVSSLVP